MHVVLCIYCKSFEVEKFCGFHRSIGKRKTFTVKHFHLVLKMAGHGSGSCIRVIYFLSWECLWNNAACQELLIHGSNVPDKINIAI